MRILICDDEPAMVKQISEIIADAYPDIELVGVHSSAELSEKLAPEDANRKFDLAFLDIAVSDESGVDIAEFVGALCPGVKIVFVSGNQDLVSKAFVTVDDCGYIYKPVDPKLLLGYIERERAGMHQRPSREYFEYTRRGSIHRIGCDKILLSSACAIIWRYIRLTETASPCRASSTRRDGSSKRASSAATRAIL